MVAKQTIETTIDSFAEIHKLLFDRLDKTKITREILELYWKYHKQVHDTLILILREKEKS